MEKLREVPHSKTIFKLSLEKTTKQLIQTVIEKLENTLNGIQISDYKIDLSNLEKPIIESFTFSTGNYCEIIGNKMFVNLNYFYK
jgi:UDP-3-O-acyl-N-acetylglucosamine deacetylase